MADTRERLPDFTRPTYDPVQQRQLTSIVERRLNALSNSLITVERKVDNFTVASDFAPISHTHNSEDILDLDLSAYLTSLNGESITDLGDVTLAGTGYLFWDGAGVTAVTGSGGGGGLADAYATFYDASGNSTSSSGADSFRFRSASAGLSVLVIDNDPTYGDHLRLTIVPSGIDHDLLANFVADEHVAHSAVTLTAGLGLTGGGDIAASRSFDVGAGEGIAANADDVALSFGSLTPQALVGADLFAFWDGANHRTVSWTDLQSGISITESQISDFGSYQPAGSYAPDFGTLTPQGVVGGDTFAFWDGDSHQSITWANLQAAISITESQISDLGNYGDLTQAEVISGGWRSSSAFAFGDAGIDTATTPGLAFYSSGIFTVSGDAQTSLHTVRVITSDATPTALTINGSGPAGTNTLKLPDNSAWTFCAHVSGRHTTSQDSCAFKVEGMIDKAATPGSVVVAGYAKTILGRDDNTWDVSVTADTTHGALQINVTGANAKTIRWMARVEITQVRY